MINRNFGRFIAISSFIFLAIIFHTNSAFAQHPCDNFPVTTCTVPSSLETWTIVDNNSIATGQVGEPNIWSPSGQKTLWYTWTAPRTRIYVADMRGTNPSNTTIFDAFLTIHSGGNTFGTITENWNADSWSFPCTFYLSTIRGTESNDSPCIFLYATAGTKYYFQVDSYGGTAFGIQGPFNLNLKPFLEPTAANASISGKVLTSQGRGIKNVQVSLTNTQTGETRNTITTSFGNYTFGDLPSGNNYIISVNSKRYIFSTNSQTISLTENLDNVDFIGQLRE